MPHACNLKQCSILACIFRHIATSSAGFHKLPNGPLCPARTAGQHSYTQTEREEVHRLWSREAATVCHSTVSELSAMLFLWNSSFQVIKCQIVPVGASKGHPSKTLTLLNFWWTVATVATRGTLMAHWISSHLPSLNQLETETGQQAGNKVRYGGFNFYDKTDWNVYLW